jgi:uncharacterized protein
MLLVVATDDAQLSKGRSTCDWNWYSPPLLSPFSFSLSLESRRKICVVVITGNRRRFIHTCDNAARALSKIH